MVLLDEFLIFDCNIYNNKEKCYLDMVKSKVNLLYNENRKKEIKQKPKLRSYKLFFKTELKA